ncbi:DNA endonuclease [Synechococcus phage S-WAM1]|jgi:hypothetical protein|uniref:2OG-Fe(II) oxygenase superfamily domain containing protein n=1 Tax=Synechococcus phage S-WAM1 TaxID=1815521 RepID=A0A1D8KSM7_9CAUD|nr:DNA endonuclease [Synechococcus phage S-WAM1]AOV61662.1 2OG-Fe(II) oxygenase superfamily domain containing protein [Synechococcus phage S-WAM1]
MKLNPEPIYYDGRLAYPRTDFIYKEKISEEVVNGILDFYNTQTIFEKWPGETIDDNGGGMVDPSIKDSMDNPVFIGITDTRVRDFTGEVNRVMNNYVDHFPLCAKTNVFKMEEFFNLQYYKPGGGYHMWHCERQSSSRSNTYRHMVWMTYLNDVPDGGTEWFHQDLYVPAEKGMTVIWPADWTFHHRGRKSDTSEKIIATGWYHFL